MDFGCDLYVYYHYMGFYSINVAANRVVGPVPPMVWNGTTEQIAAAHNAQMQFLVSAQREAIPLPYAGESFDEPTIDAALARLHELRSLGYRFPDSVLERLEQEKSA